MTGSGKAKPHGLAEPRAMKIMKHDFQIFSGSERYHKVEAFTCINNGGLQHFHHPPGPFSPRLHDLRGWTPCPRPGPPGLGGRRPLEWLRALPASWPPCSCKRSASARAAPSASACCRDSLVAHDVPQLHSRSIKCLWPLVWDSWLGLLGKSTDPLMETYAEMTWGHYKHEADPRTVSIP